jgi:hypothetical protein
VAEPINFNKIKAMRINGPEREAKTNRLWCDWRNNRSIGTLPYHRAQCAQVAAKIENSEPITAPGVSKNYLDPKKLVTNDCIKQEYNFRRHLLRRCIFPARRLPGNWRND